MTNLHTAGARLVIEGKLDAAVAFALERELSALLGARPMRVEVDLSRLRYVDGAGIALVLSFARRLQAQGGLLAVSGLEPSASIWRELVLLAQARPEARPPV
jgi:anti-anti-sigma factor